MHDPVRPRLLTGIRRGVALLVTGDDDGVVRIVVQAEEAEVGQGTEADFAQARVRMWSRRAASRSDASGSTMHRIVEGVPTTRSENRRTG
ncbi:hypothetical protein [Streptosporangium sp. NPDC002607]